MREDEKYLRVIGELRAKFWQSLPAKAYKLRTLVRKFRADQLQPGEREELELLAGRLADSGASYGFDEVSKITGAMCDLLARQRRGEAVAPEALDRGCDELDRVIDDMTIEALAVRLRELWD